MNSALRLKTNRRSTDSESRRRRDRVTCAYCQTQWGPWTGVAIQACPNCARPLFLTFSLLRGANRAKVSGLLDSINAVQGMIVMVAIIGIILGVILPRTLGQTIVMAMFVAATSHTTDGVLGFRTAIVRVLGKMFVGTHARPAAVLKATMGIVAFGLSLVGVLLFAGPH